MTIPLDASGAEISRNEVLSVSLGTTRNIQDLVRNIQTHVRAYDNSVHLKLIINPSTGKLEYRLPRFWSMHIRKGSLCTLLGFGGDVADEGIHLMDRGEAPNPVDLYCG